MKETQFKFEPSIISLRLFGFAERTKGYNLALLPIVINQKEHNFQAIRYGMLNQTLAALSTVSIQHVPLRSLRASNSRLSLVHRPGGGWAFHYDDGETGLPDDVGYHFADERFLVGEYVSLNEGGKMHTYRVTAASYL